MYGIYIYVNLFIKKVFLNPILKQKLEKIKNFQLLNNLLTYLLTFEIDHSRPLFFILEFLKLLSLINTYEIFKI